MDEHNDIERSEPRSEAQIFEDSARTCAIRWRASRNIEPYLSRLFLTVDRRDGRVIDDPAHRWSTSKLNKNEMLLLLGLMVQSPTERTYAVPSAREGFAARADELFREFHNRVLADVASTFDPKTRFIVERENSIGLFGREAIYYGAENFYLHQLLNFSRQRYREDAKWLLENVGISICPMLEIAKFILDHINAQMTEVGYLVNTDSSSAFVISRTAC